MSEKYLVRDTGEAKEFGRFISDEMGWKRDVDHTYARHDRFIKEFWPNIRGKIVARSQRNVVELGCGTGSASQAFSHFFTEVDSFDIDQGSVNVANKRKEIFKMDNVRFHAVPPKEIVNKALSRANSKTVFVLYAVLEHMTDSERIEVLRRLWKNMGPQNYLYIGNTPNRLSYLDQHTHRMPFTYSLPDEICLEYLKMDPNIRHSDMFVKAFDDGGMDAFSLIRTKKGGRGVSYHDFQIAFENFDLNECVVASDLMKPRLFHDVLLSAYMIKEDIDVPMCFGVRDMNFLVNKNPTNTENAIAHNKDVRAVFKEIVRDKFQDLFI